MAPDPDLRFFHVHVMKTAGSSLGLHIQRNFPGPGHFPNRDIDIAIPAKTDANYLYKLDEDRRRPIRAISVHLPLAVADRLGGPFVTLATLRDPVERTISWLRQHQRLNRPDSTLTEIYEIDELRLAYCDNHQVRQFAFTVDDDPIHHTDPLVMDDRRLAVARDNLERVDLVGFTEHFPAFEERLRRRYGWEIEPIPRVRRNRQKKPASDTLRERIEADSGPDREFFEYARARFG